jgi:hypothetical protein
MMNVLKKLLVWIDRRLMGVSGPPPRDIIEAIRMAEERGVSTGPIARRARQLADAQMEAFNRRLGGRPLDG